MTTDFKECPFCAETIKASAKKCKHCGEFLEGHTRESVLGDVVSGDKVAGDKTSIESIDSLATAVGASAKAEVKLGKELRDEQYEVAVNWEAKGKPRMRGFDLANRDLSDLDLTGADLRNARLKKANLLGTKLKNARLHRADLTMANMQSIDLTGADLSNANLDDAYMDNTKLYDANLCRADLTQASLMRANLYRTDLGGANLEEADLKGLIWNLDKFIEDNTKLSGASFSKQTIWPDGFDRIAAGAILVDDEGNPVNDDEYSWMP